MNGLPKIVGGIVATLLAAAIIGAFSFLWTGVRNAERAIWQLDRDADAALTMLNVDHLGLDEMDRRILLTLIEKFQGGPIGLETLATAVCEEKNTLEDVYEPFLIQSGFLIRTPRGRMATQAAYEHFNLPIRSVPPLQPTLFEDPLKKP